MAPTPLSQAAAAAVNLVAATAASSPSPVASAPSRLPLPSPELLGALSAIIPAVAFPLLPCGPSFACDVALAAASFLSCGMQLFNVLFWMAGCPSSDFAFWVFPLAAISFLVADARYSSRTSDEGPWLEPDDFGRHAVAAILVLLYEATKCAASAFLERDQVFSAHNAIVALGLVLGNIAAVYCIAEYDVLTRVVARILRCVSRREVSWWIWLDGFEGESGEKFEPFWSKILWLVVVVSAPIFCGLWWISLGMYKPAT